jgi:hypothetical protein
MALKPVLMAPEWRETELKAAGLVQNELQSCNHGAGLVGSDSLRGKERASTPIPLWQIG